MLKTTELAKGFRLGVVAMFALGIVLTELQWPEHRHRLTPETFLPRLSFRGERQRQGQEQEDHCQKGRAREERLRQQGLREELVGEALEPQALLR
jgi:hypothetical protein